MAEGASKLSEEQIFECLKSLSVPVRMNDLKAPSREFIVRVFESFVKDLEIDVSGHELRSWEATKHLEEDESYEEVITLLLLAMVVNHITNPCGLNVTVKDIVDPKPKRTKKILNYVLVFWNYYLQKCARFHDIEDSVGRRKKIEDLLIENQSLDDRYHDKLNTLNSMQPSKEELSVAVAIEEEKVTKLKMDSEVISTDYQDLKTKEAKLRNDISTADVSILTAKQRLEEFEQLILSSPERRNIEIKDMEDKIKIKDFEIKEIENRCKEAEKKVKLLEELKIEEEKDVKAVNKLTESINKLDGVVKEIVSSHQQIQEEEEKLKRLQLDIDRKKGLKLQQEHKSAKIVLSSRKQLDILNEVLEMNLKEETSHKEKIEFIKSAISEMQNHIDSEAKDIISVIAKSKEAVQKSKEKQVFYMSKMKDVAALFQSDCDEIVEAIRKAFPYDLEENL